MCSIILSWMMHGAYASSVVVTVEILSYSN